MIRRLPLAVLGLVATAARADPPPHDLGQPLRGELHRVAVLVAHEDGGPDTERLLYAERDARKVASVLDELGGFSAGDTTLLSNPTAEQVLGTLDAAEARVRAAAARGEPTLLFFYYSGHAAEGELRLGGTRLDMTALRDRLHASQAAVRLAFIDACQSGRFTRLKGGRRGPSFVTDVEPARDARGFAVITSSSEDEASQESDELRGSFFTHYLVSGLRGAADRTGDAAVTLSEAYAYAYHRTVSHTAGTRGGVQHPTYAWDLRGNGDIVLTRLAGLGALELGPGAAGAYLVYDVTHDVVVAEVEKTADEGRRLALAPGAYVVKKRTADQLLLQRVEVTPQAIAFIDEAAFRAVAFEDDVTKGPRRLALGGVRIEVAARFGYQAFFDAPTRDTLFHPTPLVGVRVDAANLVAPGLGAYADVALGRSHDELRVGDYARAERVPADFQVVVGGVGLAWEWGKGPLRFRAGPRLGAVYLRRDFPDRDLPFQDLFTLSPGLEADVAWRAGRFSLGLDARAHYLRYATETDDRSLGYGEAFIEVGYTP